MAVTLYTSRIVLNTLGVSDYGIYNVVGGFVIMFGFLNSSMASATQRFLSFEIGKKDYVQLARVFSMSINIHIIIAVGIFILAQTIGLWFVNTMLNIPGDRMIAANWVYQFSILTFMVHVISVPYNATIIAHERMKVFAWISILEVSLKLIIVLMLGWFGFDKLILYAILLFFVTLFTKLCYGFYCIVNFRESKYRFFWDKPLFKKLISYAGWNLWGSAAASLHNHGVNILLNIFFGPAINAARGIAYQTKMAINSFVQNFQMAMNPQIVKSFASNDLAYMHQLIFKGAKFSFFLLFILSLPVLIETEIILRLWLKVVPEYTVIFTQLIIINILIDSLSGPLMTAAQASGKIKLYQGVVGGLLLLIVPLSYLFLLLGYPPQVTLIISIFISIIALITRLIIISSLVKIRIDNFAKKVLLPIFPVVLFSILPSILFKQVAPTFHSKEILTIFISALSAIFSVYLLGLNIREKKFINEKCIALKNNIYRHKNRH